MLNIYRLTLILSLLFVYGNAQVTLSASIAASPTLFCSGTPIEFSAITEVTPSSYSWDIVPFKNVTHTEKDSSTVTVTFNTPGTYSVFLTAAHETATVTVLRIITVNRKAQSSFNQRLSNSGYPTELTLTNYSKYAIKNYWLIDNDFTNRDSSQNIVRYFTAGGSHTVTLLAFGTKGCNDTANYVFRISDSSSVVLPNVFSPNDDGVNDVFRPISTGILAMTAHVYTRDGVLISKWDKPNGFWDGRAFNGEACSLGEYVVIVEAIGFDGKQYKLKSIVTLIR